LLTFLSQVGLTFLGIGIGNFIGLAALGYSSDRVLKHLMARNGGQAKPEYRLPPLIYGEFLSSPGDMRLWSSGGTNTPWEIDISPESRQWHSLLVLSFPMIFKGRA